MTIFKPSGSTDVKITGEPPQAAITTLALQKMQAYTALCSEEVGWLGTVTREGNRYTVHDCYLFSQDVHATTTEITPEGLSSFAEDLLQQEDGMEVWNSLKVWGHSHVNMSTSPSGQDDDQMEVFKDNDFFLRIITNKKGDLRVDVYDFNLSVAYLNVAWTRLVYGEEAQLLEQINTLKDELEQLETQFNDIFNANYSVTKKEVQPEIKKKVRKITYKTPTYPYGIKTQAASLYEQYVPGVGIDDDEDITHIFHASELEEMAGLSRAETQGYVEEVLYAEPTYDEVTKLMNYLNRRYNNAKR